MRSLIQNKMLPWALAFLFTQVIIQQHGETNERSRFATLHAMVSQHKFRIDSFKDWTIDWAKTPDGHYYSNKAPGPMFLAYPLMWLIEETVPETTLNRMGATEEDRGPAGWIKSLVSILLQAIPYSLVSLALLAELERQKVRLVALHYAAIAIFFGNTVTIFMNNFFGHAMAASFLLMAALAFFKKNSFWFGLSLGFALLCDYGSAMILVPWLLAFFWLNRKCLSVVGLGALLPASLWIWYHTICFGSPFVLPMKFQNPGFVDLHSNELWGVFSFQVHVNALKELLWGSTRGILFTQPWIYPVFIAGVASLCSNQQKINRMLFFSTILGLMLLIWMNMGFNGWHGGGSAGPRYLSIIFPLFAIIGALVYDRWAAPAWHACLWLTLACAVALRFLIYIHTPIPEAGRALWPFYIDFLFQINSHKRAYLKIICFILPFALACWLARKKGLELNGQR